MKLFRFYSICVGLHLAISALAIRIALRSPPPAIPTTLGSHLSKTPPPVLADSGPPNTLYGGWNHPWGYGTVGKKNPQQFRLMFDTGSGRTWVAGKTTDNKNPGYDYSGTPLNFSISAGYGKKKMKRFSESGPAYADDFTFDDFKAKDLQFFVAKNGLEEFGIDGVVGMEYKTTKATDNNYTGFFETLIQQNAVHTNEFSFFFGRENIEEDELTLGGRDPAKFSGKFTTAPVTGMGDGWRIQLEGVAVNEKPVSCVAPQTIYIDTGTYLINVNTTIAAAIHSEIPGAGRLPAQYLGYDTYAYPCNTTAQYMPSIVIAGQSLTIDPLDFNDGPVDTSKLIGIEKTLQEQPMCQSVIYGSKLDGRFILGAPFMTSWYTVFEWGKEPTGKEIGVGTGVSFAKAVHPASASAPT